METGGLGGEINVPRQSLPAVGTDDIMSRRPSILSGGVYGGSPPPLLPTLGGRPRGALSLASPSRPSYPDETFRPMPPPRDVVYNAVAASPLPSTSRGSARYLPWVPPPPREGNIYNEIPQSPKISNGMILGNIPSTISYRNRGGINIGGVPGIYTGGSFVLKGMPTLPLNTEDAFGDLPSPSTMGNGNNVDEGHLSSSPFMLPPGNMNSGNRIPYPTTGESNTDFGALPSQPIIGSGPADEMSFALPPPSSRPGFGYGAIPQPPIPRGGMFSNGFPTAHQPPITGSVRGTNVPQLYNGNVFQNGNIPPVPLNGGNHTRKNRIILTSRGNSTNAAAAASKHGP